MASTCSNVINVAENSYKKGSEKKKGKFENGYLISKYFLQTCANLSSYLEAFLFQLWIDCLSKMDT